MLDLTDYYVCPVIIQLKRNYLMREEFFNDVNENHI